MDNFEKSISEGRNLIDPNQFSVDGTLSETVNVSMLVG